MRDRVTVVLETRNFLAAMELKTCLLVSDDPDDHIQFGEALEEVANETVMLIVMDPAKALDLLSYKRHIPDYIIVDMAMTGLPAESFLQSLEEIPWIEQVSVIAYGEFSEMDRIVNKRVSKFVDIEYSYSRLCGALSQVVGRDR